jgi:hypothetical protein
MKKLLRKRVILPLIVVAVVAIGAAIAYAAWMSTATSTASATTATVMITANDSATDSWTIANPLVPASPNITVASGVVSCDSGRSGATPVVVSATADTPIVFNGSTYVYWHLVTIKNTGSTGVNVKLTAISASGGALDWNSVLHTAVYTSYGLSYASTQGGTAPTLISAFTPPAVSAFYLGAGQSAKAVIGLWLDTNASTSFEGQSLSVSYTFSTDAIGS